MQRCVIALVFFCAAAASPLAAWADSGILSYSVNGHAYQRVDTPSTWSQARAACESRGGYLATLTSQAENDFVYANFGLPGIGVNIWLGASDTTVEGTWQWVTGEPWSYTNWEPGQPDNDAGGGQDYLAFSAWDNLGRWDDAGLPSEDATRPYICEWNAPSAPGRGFIPITTSAVDRQIFAHDAGSILLEGHGATGTAVVPGWTWNYTGNFADARYPAHISAFNATYLCIGPTPLPASYNCDTRDNIAPAGDEYAGYEYFYFPFTLPADAYDVRLYIAFQNADDRHALMFNGSDYGMFKAMGAGSPDLAASITMTGASNKTYTLVKNTDLVANRLQVTDRTAFNIGGTNTLRVWINNTDGGVFGSASPYRPSVLNLWGYVTYSTPASPGTLYVANRGADPGVVSRVGLDGTGGVALNIGSTSHSPTFIALDPKGGKMYLTNHAGATLARANLDGTGSVNLGNLGGYLGEGYGDPIGIALDTNAGKMYVVVGGSGLVVRASLDGSSPEPVLYSPPLSNPYGIALDTAAGKLYVANTSGNSVLKANLDGTSPVTLALGGLLAGPAGIALDVANDKMYVVSVTGNKVTRANLDGSSAANLGNLDGSLTNPYGIALDLAMGKMYVTNYHAPPGGTVIQANLDGTGGVSIGNLNGTLNHGVGLAILGAGAPVTTGSTLTAVPIAALTGSYNTEVHVRNGGAEEITLDVGFYEADNSSVPGLRTCNTFTVPANTTVPLTLGTQCTLGAGSHFGMLVLENTWGSQPFTVFSRSQTPQGVGFSVEGAPVGTFSVAPAHAEGLRRTGTGAHYLSNCFIGALDSAVDYRLDVLAQNDTPIGNPITGSLEPYHMVRHLDVLNLAGAPAGDYSNVRVRFSETGSGSPPFVGFCTMQESVTFGADFRIAKPADRAVPAVVVPIVAQTASYSTEVHVRNHHAQDLTLSVNFHEADNSSVPGPRPCAPFVVPANTTAPLTLGSQCTLGAGSHFGMLVLENATGTLGFTVFSRSQTPQGVGFSVEGFPLAGFGASTVAAEGLKRTAIGPKYLANCFVGALGAALDYRLDLLTSDDVPLGAPLTGALQANRLYRYLDVLAAAGAPAGDYAGVRAKFSRTAGSGSLLGFCTMQESLTFSADFRIGK